MRLRSDTEDLVQALMPCLACLVSLTMFAVLIWGSVVVFGKIDDNIHWMSIRKWKSWHIVWIWLSRSVLNLESWRQRCGKLLRIQTIYVCFCLLDLWVGFTSSLGDWLLALFLLFIAWKRLENLRKSTMPTRFQRPCLLSWTFKFKNWIFFQHICNLSCFLLYLRLKKVYVIIQSSFVSFPAY